jgi:hypothetical protein
MLAKFVLLLLVGHCSAVLSQSSPANSISSEPSTRQVIASSGGANKSEIQQSLVSASDWLCEQQVSRPKKPRRLVNLSDLSLAAIVPVYEGPDCDQFSLEGFLTAASVLYATQVVNLRRLSDVDGIRQLLGFDIRCSCSDMQVRYDGAILFFIYTQ